MSRRCGCLLWAWQHDQRGAVAVEFALVASAFLLLVLGVLDFGLGIWEYNNLSHAVRQGARFAAVRGYRSPLGQVGPVTQSGTCNGSPLPSVVQEACTQAFALDTSQVTVDVTWEGCADWNGTTCTTWVPINPSCSGCPRNGDTVKVEGHYVYRPFLTNLFNVTINLRSASRMMIACCAL